MQAWSSVGFDTRVSVNVSGQLLLQPTFVENLTAILNDFPTISPECLTLEVLETSALEDVTEVAETMRRCAELGVEFAVDDFGTGYSSLTYLKRLPASLLKIDQSFIRDMLEDSDDMAIVKGVISLATAFQREVIAEGLENSEQGEKLLTLGCDLAQGYGIARPMAAEYMPEWAKAWVQDTAWQQHPMQQSLRI
ncbi:EAL domain-containing protein [Saccharophagus degradans]|nr:EAL domain-containing protein [Saccharophagus degradans]WGO98639.1 EAL domain-containing protein [Saccharophagus degradans]